MARVGEAEIGVVSYNGYTFDGAFNIEISGRDVMDEAGRITIYTEYTLTVHAVIGDAAGTDTEMAEIHRKLSKSGEILRIETKGFGNAILVGGIHRREVMYGPIPQVRSWKPLGAHMAAEVTWTCTFRLVECGGQISNVRGVMAANYSVDIALDRHGNTTRTIAGYMLIVNNVIARRMTETPDAFRTWIRGEPPLGFSRQQHYSFNAAKNRIDFQIIDTEVASHNNAYPELMSEAKGGHRTSWQLRKSGVLRHSMRLTLHPRADVSQVDCWRIAIDMLKKRRQVQDNAVDCDGNSSTTIVDGFEVDEDFWGRPVDITFEWRQLHSLRHLIADTGLFSPVVGTNWSTWRTSMAKWAHDPRGNAKWMLGVNDDIVVDLCVQNKPVINDQVANYPVQAAQYKGLLNQNPTKETSWLKYDQTIVPQQKRPTVQQAILQQTDTPGGVVDMQADVLPNFGNGGAIDTVDQQSSAAVHNFFLSGQALRVGFPVPKPKIQTIGGQPAVEVGGSFAHGILYNALGLPVYGARWLYRYVVKNSPGTVKPKTNVEQKVDEDGNACRPIP